EPPQPDAKGFKVIMDLSKESIPAANTSITARKSWVATHKDVVQRSIHAIIEGIAGEDRDRTYALHTLAKWPKAPDDPANTAPDSLYSGIGQSLPYSKPEQLAPAQAQLGKSNDKVKNYGLSKLSDSSFIKNAANRGLGK